MNKTKCTFGVLATFLFIITCATAGQAAPRTFVSGSGSDGNAPGCTFTLPCRFLSTAYANTDVGGEIIALTAAGYGGLAITHAITVETVPGTFGFISVVASSAGITVNAGATEGVVIRNFQFSATPTLAAGSIGIQHTSGKLVVENCVFSRLETGLSNTSKMDLINSDFFSNTTGVVSNGSGINSPGNPSVAPVALVRINGGNITGNTTGLLQQNPGTGPSSTNLSNIAVFAPGGSTGALLNLIGNTTNAVCTGTMFCSALPQGYQINSYP